MFPYNSCLHFLRDDLQELKIAKEAGVTICFGTDLLGPLCTMCSLVNLDYVLRFKRPLRSSKTATVNAAKMLGRGGGGGFLFLDQIAPGFAAVLSA